VVADEAFDALADPVRREILTLLSQRDECSAGELSEQISRVGRTAVSSHLRVLRTAGLIAERRTGRFRYYSVDPNGPAQEVIQLLIELFQGSLDATKAAAENTAASTDRVGITRSGPATSPRPVAGAAHPDGSVRRAM
jgi:ArsR family transcriptional regulator, arsenate/arsenite/antimonite-responsive transcriptional repressor